MPKTEYIALIYFALVSLVAIILTISDKSRAKNDRWRIKESTLMIVGLLGGAFAEYVTMKAIRHKTKHSKFMVGLPLIIILHIAILLFIFIKVAQ